MSPKRLALVGISEWCRINAVREFDGEGSFRHLAGSFKALWGATADLVSPIVTVNQIRNPHKTLFQPIPAVNLHSANDLGCHSTLLLCA